MSRSLVARWACAPLTFLVLVTASCGGAESPADAAAEAETETAVPAATEPVATSTTAPVTTIANTVAESTTVPATTTTSSTTSSTTTTLAVQESEPIAPPPDAHASEPVIELGTLAIPKIGVEMTMYEGIRLTTLDFGPGHWPGSAMPGQVGNVVVAGHRTSKHKVFRNVDQLVAGDEIVFTDDTGVHVYVVERVEIIEPTELWIVDPTDTPRATLFACHPPGSTAQRIAVFADLVTDG